MTLRVLRMATAGLGLALVAAGCNGSSGASEPKLPPAGGGAEPVACTDPRPEMCTHDYRPVCAQRDNGVRCVTTPCDSTDARTYPNACSACADPKVYSWVPGACEEDE